MKKILFNDRYGLTEAVLNGRKTMTRRIVPKRILNEVKKYQEEYYNGALATISEEDAILALCTYEHRFKLPYQVGEVVAIAQSYMNIAMGISGKYEHTCITDKEDLDTWSKYVDMQYIYPNAYTNKMFTKAELMPHHIRITNIRVEKLQDISDEDCLREGVRETAVQHIDGKRIALGYTYEKEYLYKHEYPASRNAFSALINRVSGKGTWERNPYVIVYEFELVD